MLKPQAYPKGDKRGEMGVCDEKGVCPDAVFEGTEHLTPNQQKTLDQEEEDRGKTEPHQDELGDMYEQEEHTTERIKEIEAEEKKLKEEHRKTGRQPANPKKKKAVVINILSRLKSLDFLLRREPLSSGTWEAVRLDQKEQEEKKKKKKKEAKKDGEFGGMNTGEVEWTEPRDTANSRTKRKKENVA